jgi:prepilin-type N-terminal cleavage/methylation domain-containing protein
MARSDLPTARRRKRQAQGFTLIEVLVAFVILGVASVALYRGFSSGLSGIGAAAERTVAVLHARSKLDEVGIVIPLEPGEVSGTFEDGLAWSVAIAPFVSVTEEAALDLPMAVYEVNVTVVDAGGFPVTLTSYRLALLP